MLLVCTASLEDATAKSYGKTRGGWLKDVFLKDVNGGSTCAACSILSGLMQQLAEIHNVSIIKAVDMFCSFLPDQFQAICSRMVEVVSYDMIALLEKETPDVFCYTINLCKNDTGEFCRLFPAPKMNPKEDIFFRVAKVKNKISSFLPEKGIGPLLSNVFIDICQVEPIKHLCDSLNNHTPYEDADGDNFSTRGTIRGFYWRGKDCDDKNLNIYPGRYTANDSVVDTNCNGILGVESGSGQTYESLWCRDSEQMGTIVLGDSASAHFHIPPSWLTSEEINKETYKDLLLVLENEFDWPMMSSSTGFMNSSWPVSISGEVDSTYLRLLELNRCNHRDFQNIAVNGARAGPMADEIVKTFARRGTDDNPIFLTLALIGNDVCNGHPNMDHMTKPGDFYTHILETLNYVDQHVASGSVAIGVGLVDGRILFDILANRIHPIGSLHKDVTYAQVYDYLNCLQISPCFGWLNSNETWRNLTTGRAEQLNTAFKSVVANNTFKNLKVIYIDPPLPEAIREMGHNPWELIEPVDGFHPSQAGNALTTKLTFKILAGMEGVLPRVNPFNDKIREKFGDQGGYL